MTVKVRSGKSLESMVWDGVGRKEWQGLRHGGAVPMNTVSSF